MKEKILRMSNVDQLAVESKTDNYKREKLISDYIPFILSCAQKVTGRYIDISNDEEYSVALEAFSEAIEHYDIDKGAFLSYSNQVIRSRLYDHYRKTKRYKQAEVFDDMTEEDGPIISLDEKVSSEKYIQQVQNNDLVLEIKMLNEELQKWDISFNELSDISPKHKSTRKMCIQIGEYIRKDSDLYHKFISNKQLPAKIIEENFKIPIKKFERFRKYIIAVVIIKSGGFEQISTYIK